MLKILLRLAGVLMITFLGLLAANIRVEREIAVLQQELERRMGAIDENRAFRLDPQDLESGVSQGKANYMARLDPVGQSDGLTDASGLALISINDLDGTIEYALEIDNIENFNQAHILVEQDGNNQEIVAWLYPSVERSPEIMPGKRAKVMVGGEVKQENLVGALQGKPLDDLKTAIEEGKAHVSVSTEQNSSGEIEGRVMPVRFLQREPKFI